MSSVSRGLLATELRSLRSLRSGDPVEIAARKFGRLADCPVGSYAWRECRDWASRLYRGLGDERGRRLFSEAGRTDARYVARVARRALAGVLPEGKQWGNLRESIRRILVELSEGAQ